ncbi:MAG TPA: hypothetical protein VK550_00940 [Polyangiaceae bacterium]|nr:hypothetical protein [Polyangiaceae bacterium]
MSAAVSLDWAGAGPAPRRSGRRRAKRLLRAVPAPARFFAVQCMVCDQLGPLAPKEDRGFSPAKRSGWRFLLLSEMRGWVCPDCHHRYQRLLPPPTRGDCIDGPRPCPKTLCKFHLCGDVSRKAPKDFELVETCTLDIVDKHDEGMTLNDIGKVLSMTREGSRYILLACVAKLRAVTGLAWDLTDDDLEADG